MLRFFLATTLLPLALLVPGCDRARPEARAARVLTSGYEIEVEVAKATIGRVTTRVELTGTLLARRRSVIVSEVDAVIASIPRPADAQPRTPEELARLRAVGLDLEAEPLGLGLGDEVPAGEVLVQLVTRDFELALAAAEAKLEKARADVVDLRAWKRPEEVQRLRALQLEADASLQQARRDLERAESLREKDAVTAAEYDRRETELKTRDARLKQASAALRLAQAGPTATELAVKEALLLQAESEVAIATERLRKTKIRAPYDCTVTDRFVEIGERVTALPRVEILEVMDLRLVIAQVGVPERFVGQLEVGDGVTVHVQDVVESLSGVVVRINDKVDSETRTYRTRIAVDNRERRFKAGQFVRVVFEISSTADTLTVPARAVTYAGGRPQVFVLEEGRAARRAVTLGMVGDGKREIRSGLLEADEVVVDDPTVLADGMSVTVRDARATSTRGPEEDGAER